MSCNILLPGIGCCAGLDADIQKIMSELSWGTKPKFLEYIDIKKNITKSSSDPRHVKGIQKVRQLLRENIPKAERRRWDSLFEEINDYVANRNKRDLPVPDLTSDQLIRRARSVGATIYQEWNQSDFETSTAEDETTAPDPNLTAIEGSLLGAHDWIESLSETYKDEDDNYIASDHIRRARSLDSTLLSSQGWNQSLFQTSKDEDDGVMKMKLFRLMYESVKDSDLKIKRAELVKADYENSTGFDLGYVCGDAADKLNVMTDISKTLKRMYDVWKPVEHVNAYEQIANLAIEITHLVDMVRMIEPKKEPV